MRLARLIGCGMLGFVLFLPLPSVAGRGAAPQPNVRAQPEQPPPDGPAPHRPERRERPVQPQGEVLLRVSRADGREIAFDRRMLESLPQVSFETSTLWTEGATRFSGPLLRDVLAEAGISSGQIELWALNDYMAQLQVQDLTAEAPIIATRRNGAAFGARDSGPLWVIYPYDADAAWRTEEVYAASVWQLLAIKAVHP